MTCPCPRILEHTHNIPGIRNWRTSSHHRRYGKPRRASKTVFRHGPGAWRAQEGESMSEPSGSYPEILRQLWRIVARGREAEKLLRLGDETLPKETLDELVRDGRQAQIRLDKFQPPHKYYTVEYSSGPWSMALSACEKIDASRDALETGFKTGDSLPIINGRKS